MVSGEKLKKFPLKFYPSSFKFVAVLNLMTVLCNFVCVIFVKSECSNVIGLTLTVQPELLLPSHYNLIEIGNKYRAE